MRVLSMIKADTVSESDQMADPAEMAAMGKMAEESIRRGLILDQGGLRSSRHGARVTFVDGKPSVTDGPFAETKELVAGYAILKVKDLDQAIEEALKLPMKRELEIRPIFELEGYELTPNKPNGKQRWMLLLEPHGETTEPPSTDIIEAMDKYNKSLIAAGVLLGGDGLQPSVAGARVNLGTREVVRGPFTNKYLMCGWWTIQVDTKAEAIEWAKRVPMPNGTIEIRQMFNPHTASIPVDSQRPQRSV